MSMTADPAMWGQ